MEGLTTLAIAAIILGLALYILAGRMNYKKEEYEFKNRTDGGVVKYKSFKHVNNQNNKGCLIKFLGGLGMIIMLLGLLMFFVG